MKVSQILQQRDRLIQNQFEQKNKVTSSMSQSSVSHDLLESVFKLMEFLAVRQQRVQVLKQMLTERSDFSPQALYYYISMNQNQIDKRDLIQLFQENLVTITDQQSKLYFNSYGYKEKIDYSAFINLIFPVDVHLLKQISVTGIKKYANQDKVNEEVLCIFIMLVQEEISMLEDFDLLKNTFLPKISRKQLKNLVRIIKKNGDCHSQMEIQSQAFIKYEQLRTLFKNLITKTTKNTPNSARKQNTKGTPLKPQIQAAQPYSIIQKNLSCVFRKLSMGKTNFINFEDLQFWLKPWNRTKPTLINGDQFAVECSNIIEISGINQIQNQSHVTLGQSFNLPFSHQCS